MENYVKIIKKLPLWDNRDILVKKLSGGITNFNYLIQDDRKKYVARFAPKLNVLLGDEEDQLFDLQQKVSQAKYEFIKGQAKKHISEATAFVEASDDYKTMKKQ